MDVYLKETFLLNFYDSTVQLLITAKGWNMLPEKERILTVYNFVRDEIKFGYNTDDEIPASRVLADGYGQCNTKSILFMALLRALGIACRLHGFKINKELQKGIFSGIWYKAAPAELIHTWVEIFYQDRWLNMEGFILDLTYLKALQEQFNHCSGSFCGFGVATKDLHAPMVYWKENNTYIQKEGITRDLGIFDDPDSFFEKHSQNLHCLIRMIYRNIVRHCLNKNVEMIRNLAYKKK